LQIYLVNFLQQLLKNLYTTVNSIFFSYRLLYVYTTQYAEENEHFPLRQQTELNLFKYYFISLIDAFFIMLSLCFSVAVQCCAFFVFSSFYCLLFLV